MRVQALLPHLWLRSLQEQHGKAVAVWETPEDVDVRLFEPWQLLVLSTQFQTSIRDAAETDSLASLPVYAVQRVAICGIRCVPSIKRALMQLQQDQPFA